MPARPIWLVLFCLWLVLFCTADETVDVAVDASGGQAQVGSDAFAAAKVELAELVASLTGGARSAPDANECVACVEPTAQTPARLRGSPWSRAQDGARAKGHGRQHCRHDGCGDASVRHARLEPRPSRPHARLPRRRAARLAPDRLTREEGEPHLDDLAQRRSLASP